ncbi:phosphatase [Brachybacterium ginsengisoli]|uniref:Phosphatase n=1 Tax=Brachybacterium ginsengisoli TaxID=1331682 RepID=A0A291GZ70_9MICO|nr:HAD hydrolase-like protein [Brachybacterium ginsengisoli]ATG55495.1 phosphatase [Brachybacterium ginsengisoli]
MAVPAHTAPPLPTSPDLRQVPVVLLDLDGTIVESGPGILAALDHAFAVCGEQHPGDEVLQGFIGPPLSDSFRGVLGLSAARAERLRQAYNDHYLEHGVLSSAPYPGMRELIAALRAEGRTVAVATNKPESTAIRLLRNQGLADELDLIGGTDAAAGRRDKAAVIEDVLLRLGDRVRAGAVMVGDRLHDAEGAAAHGLPAVLVGWGYGGELERASGLPVAETVPELSALLRG